MIKIDYSLEAKDLKKPLDRLFELSGEKILNLQSKWKPESGTPVFTVAGKYTSRGWTEWTQGFQFGSAVLQYDVTGEEKFLEMGRETTLAHMASHVSHIGVHDHGFNNVSTYGNLHRLALENKFSACEWEINFYELALKITGAVQAARWTATGENSGYIYSFNGPHSLFADTIRSLRALAVSYQLGHVLMGEKDRKVCLLERLIQHADTTAKYNVFFGKGRDAYDLRGRVAHESVFNLNDGSFRCPNSQQGYSPFSTWTRGLAWILCGYPEEIEFLDTLPEKAFAKLGGKKAVIARFLETAQAVADFYIAYTPTDGIPYWDTGAPGLAYMGDYLDEPADPYNEFEPVDSSAAVIAAQGLIRLGLYLKKQKKVKEGETYYKAGLTVAKSAFSDPYLSHSPKHQGLILHSVYHRPNGWDYIPKGASVPQGESSMWGDYHARELGVLIHRIANKKPYYKFFLGK